MRTRVALGAWLYIIAATIMEVATVYLLPSSSWLLRNVVIGTIAVTITAVIVIFYMELRYQPRWESVYVLYPLFFAIDLLLIWTASLAH